MDSTPQTTTGARVPLRPVKWKFAIPVVSIDLDSRVFPWKESNSGEADSDGPDADGDDWRPDWAAIDERDEVTDSE